MSRPLIGPRAYFVLPAPVLARVDAVAEARGVSRGVVLREAVIAYLRKEDRIAPHESPG